MKKFLLVLITLSIIFVFTTSCTLAPKVPSEGIFYNNELKMAIEFGESNDIVHSYDEKLSHMDLQIRNWIDGCFEIVWDNGGEDVVYIYTGWRKYTSKDKFVIVLFAKANPEDDFKTQIEFDDVEYIFTRIESYAEIGEINE